jgi:hypothetical protein
MDNKNHDILGGPCFKVGDHVIVDGNNCIAPYRDFAAIVVDGAFKSSWGGYWYYVEPENCDHCGCRSTADHHRHAVAESILTRRSVLDVMAIL